MGRRPSMDLERAEIIARDPGSVTRKELKDAFFFTRRNLPPDDEEDDNMPFWLRRRFVVAHHSLEIHMRELPR